MSIECKVFVKVAQLGQNRARRWNVFRYLLEEESEMVSEWLATRKGKNVLPHEIGVVVRWDEELTRARAVVEKAGLGLL